MENINDRSLVLSLKFGESVINLIPVANADHSVSIDPELYKDGTLYLGQSGKLRGDLINKETGFLEWIFKDGSDDEDYNTGIIGVMSNPMKLSYEEITRHACVLINTVQELKFLETVERNVPYNGGLVENDAARLLMELLNVYQIGDGWTCNPGIRNTTAGFTLLYIGGVETLPKEYKINPNAAYVAIVELTTYSGRAVYSLTVGKV